MPEVREKLAQGNEAEREGTGSKSGSKASSRSGTPAADNGDKA